MVAMGDCVAFLLALIATLPFAIAYLRRTPTEEGLIRVSVSLPDKVVMSGTTPGVAISPDGRHIAFVATREDLYCGCAHWIHSRRDHLLGRRLADRLHRPLVSG